MAEVSKSQLEALQRFSEMFTEGAMTRKDAKQFMEMIVKLLSTLSQQLNSVALKIADNSDSTNRNMDSKFSTSLSDIKNQLNSLFVEDKIKGMDKNMRAMFSMMKTEIGSIVDKKLKEVDVEVRKRAIPGRPGPKGDPGAVSLEIAREALKEPIAEFTKNWDSKVQSLIDSKRMAGGTPHNLLQTIDVSTQIDGTNRTFTSLPTARHYPMIYSSQAPFVLIPNIHYTIGRKSITITNNIDAPQSGTGQFLVVCYIK